MLLLSSLFVRSSVVIFWGVLKRCLAQGEAWEKRQRTVSLLGELLFFWGLWLADSLLKKMAPKNKAEPLPV